MPEPKMPENTCAEHQVSCIDRGQSCVGNDLQDSVLTGLVIVRMLVKMVSAEVQGVIDLDVFLGEDFGVYNDLQLAYVIANDSLIA